MEKIMSILWDSQGVFVSRPNRFLAIVKIDRKEERVHVRDPGRLEELLYPGNRVRVRHRPEKNRKTSWEIIAAWDHEWVLINSGYHRAISELILKTPEISPLGELEGLEAEVTVGRSRLDFMGVKDEKSIGIEVKGCTLAIDEVALFPDAPTERGRKHVDTLAGMVEKGHRAAIIILVFRHKAKCFGPNENTDPKFAEAFRRARKAGVEVYPLRLSYEEDKIVWHGPMPICGVT